MRRWRPLSLTLPPQDGGTGSECEATEVMDGQLVSKRRLLTQKLYGPAAVMFVGT